MSSRATQRHSSLPTTCTLYSVLQFILSSQLTCILSSHEAGLCSGYIYHGRFAVQLKQIFAIFKALFQLILQYPCDVGRTGASVLHRIWRLGSLNQTLSSTRSSHKTPPVRRSLYAVACHEVSRNTLPYSMDLIHGLCQSSELVLAFIQQP